MTDLRDVDLRTVNPENMDEQLIALNLHWKGDWKPKQNWESTDISEALCQHHAEPSSFFNPSANTAVIEIPACKNLGKSMQGCNMAVAVTANLPQIWTGDPY